MRRGGILGVLDEVTKRIFYQVSATPGEENYYLN